MTDDNPTLLPPPYKISVDDVSSRITLADEPWTLYLDESYDNELLTVAGLAAPDRDLHGLTDSWRELKTAMGAAPDDELKFNAGSRVEVRRKLDAAGWPHQQRVPAMLSHIAGTGVIVFANTSVDARGDHKPLKWYPDTLDWVVRRFANCFPITDRGLPLRTVVLDTPPDLPNVQDEYRTPHLENILRCRGKGPATYYRRRWAYSHETHNGSSLTPLRRMDFAPDLRMSHAAVSDLLQMADLLAGMTHEFVKSKLRSPVIPSRLGPPEDYQDRNFKLIAPQVRRGRQPSTYGFGIYASSTDRRAAAIRQLIDNTCISCAREHRLRARLAAQAF